jgi:hypothetical protein
MIDLVSSGDAFHEDLVEVKYLVLEVLPRAQFVLRQLKVGPVKGLLLLGLSIFLLFFGLVFTFMRLKHDFLHCRNELPELLRGHRPQVVCTVSSVAALWLRSVLIKALLMEEGLLGGALVLVYYFGDLLELYF